MSSARSGQRGIKVVMSTHDLGEARRLASEIVMLHRGRVIETGRRNVLLQYTANRGGTEVHRRRIARLINLSEDMRCSPAACSIAVAAAVVFGASAVAQDKSIVVASTTSTQDSGLFGYILPLFKAKTGIDVKVVAQGTGQALDTGRRGDADVVFVHARPRRRNSWRKASA